MSEDLHDMPDTCCGMCMQVWPYLEAPAIITAQRWKAEERDKECITALLLAVRPDIKTVQRTHAVTH